MFTFLPDADYLVLQLAVARINPLLGAALTFRGTTELSRKAIGSVFNGVLTLSDSVTSAYNAAKSYTSDVWNAIIRQSKIKLGISPSTANQINSPQTLTSSFQVTNSNETATTARSLETIDNFWDAIPDWGDDAWQATTKWSEDAWNSIDEWTPQTWQRTTTWTAGDWTKPFFTISNPTLTEGNTGTSQLNFSISLSTPSSQTVTVNYATADGTANAAEDYTATSGVITFAPSQTTQTISIPIIGDINIEPDETFFINLTDPTNANITDAQGLGTILNEDNVALPTITLAVSPTSVTEDGATNLVYTFTRTGATTNALTVNYGIAGTADNTDYTGATPGTGKTITFIAGSDKAILTIDPTTDTTPEADETVALTLAAGTGYAIATPTSVTGTIINDDFVKINLSPNGRTVVEGMTSPQTLNYAVNLSNSSNQTITVHYNTANGTALAGSDYTAQTGTLTFSPGVTRQTITIPILNNSINEANETFTLKLTNPTHAVLGGVATVTTTITDTLSAIVTTPLPANVENLKLNGTNAINGTGNAGNNILTGNNANNLLNGGNGNDRLNGGAGIDSLVGGLGNDRYQIDSITDTLTELSGQGTDTVQSAVTFSLAALANIENLTLTGSSTLNGTGNLGNNVLIGNNANNTLSGDAGNDTLTGAGGKDTLTGGAGNDQFLFRSGTAFTTTSFGTDTITDFLKGIDKIALSKASFTALTSAVGGNLQTAEFAIINTAANEQSLAGSSSAKLIFNSATGNLFYNPDSAIAGFGNGGLFATVNGSVSLDATDFWVQA